MGQTFAIELPSGLCLRKSTPDGNSRNANN
jgi:hypothetical protein